MTTEAERIRLTRLAWLRTGATVLVASCMTTRGGEEPRREPNRRPHMVYDAVIVGGGPAGLAAALALGRARKRVLVCDSGPRRNAAAERIHNFVTRDGTPPDEFRRVGREQLEAYQVHA
jgi:NADPH-dependent 2,4-dienoyl-CoA reductase/sulfur reductase-like enzyme